MTGKIENKFVVVTLVMALVAMVFVGGYLWDKNGGVPRSGIEGSYLEISRVPPLNETAYLTAVITPKHNYTDHGNISARIVLPEGFIFIDHDDTSTLYYDRILEWGGNLTKGTNVIFGGTIKSVKIGNWTIHAKLIWGDVPINETDNPENSYEVIGILYIHVDVDSAYIHDGPFPKPGGPDVQEGYPFVPRSPMNVNLSLSNAPPLNQTAKLTCAVSSIEDAPNTTAEIVLPEGFELINGDIIWNGNIPRDGEIEFNVTIKSIKNGNWTIEASAKCMISHDSWFENGDRIYIFVSEDKASISDEPPILPECSGMGIKLNESEIPPFESIKSNSSDTNVSLPSPVELNNASRIGSGGTLTIKGRFWYKDANDNSQPLKWATVWIYDAEWWGWDYLGATLTDTDGRFTFGPISNDDGWGQDGLDIICEAVAHTSASRVESPFWGIVYKWHTQEYTNCPDGTLDVGNWIGPSSQEGAWRIFEYITDGWDYLMNGPAGYEMAKATAKWPDGDWPYYTLGGEIHIPGDDKADRSPDIVQHEYAHHVMYTIYNGYWPPNTGGSHNINTESNVNTAWTEGWADFFPLASQNDSYFTYLGHYNIDLETPTGYWEDGDKVEGRVAGALWDIFDSANDGYDTFSDGFVNIWDTISNQVDDTYHEFYESWVSRGHDQCGFLLTAYQNTIDYNDPPTCTITLPNGGGWYSGTITITASASDDDGLVEKVEFQYSQDHGNWYDIGTDTSPSGGWSINWNTESITDSSVWVRARAYDGMEWSGWDESDSSFGIDNTPPYPPIVTEHHCGGSHSGWPAWTMHTSPYFTWSNPGDEGSGIDHCEVQVNDGEWSTVSSGWHPTYGSGEYRFDFRAIDGVDLASDEYRIYVRIDVMPPITTHSLSGTEGNNNWWKSNVGVTLSASDEHSGVDYTKYRIDGGAWNTGNTFTVSGNGIHTVEYYSVDNAGNEEEHHSVVIKIETTTTPPTTTHSLSGTMGENGWYVSNVVVTLTATDDVSGVDYTKYRIDSGSWQTYSAPFTVSTNGEHTVDYYSVDNVGNEESQKSVSFKIDKTPPTATITRPKEGYLYFLDIEIGPTPNGNTIIVGRITIKADASDETSGIDKVEFYINDELKYTDEGAPYEWEWHPGISFNPTIKVVAYDEAGNSNSDSMVVYAYTEEDWEGQ